MKKINILFLGTLFEKGSGSDEVGIQISKSLNKRKYTLFHLSYLRKGNKKFPSLNIPYTEIFFLRIFLIFLNIPKLYFYCKKNKIDYIISLADFLNVYSILTNFFLKIKIIPTIHISSKIFFKNPIIKYGFRLLYKAKKIIKIVCVSKENEEYLNSINIKNTITIYNFFDIKKLIKLSKKKLEKKEDLKIFQNKKNFFLINVARFGSIQKGQSFLIRVMKEVVSKNKNIKLLIIGWDSDEKNKYRALIKVLNLNKNITYLGKRNNVFPYLKKSNCFVLSSIFEGLPLVLIEALSCSIPIISTDCSTGPREILNNDLSFKKKIKYPYFSDYGILVKTFKRKYNFNELENNKLSKQEVMLKNIILKISRDKKLQNRYSKGIKRALFFDKKIILKKWEYLLRQ